MSRVRYLDLMFAWPVIVLWEVISRCLSQAGVSLPKPFVHTSHADNLAEGGGGSFTQPWSNLDPFPLVRTSRFFCGDLNAHY